MDAIKPCYVLLKRISIDDMDLLNNPPNKKQKHADDVDEMGITMVMPNYYPQPHFDIIRCHNHNDKLYQVEVFAPGISPERLTMKSIGRQLKIDADAGSLHPFHCSLLTPANFDIKNLKCIYSMGRIIIQAPFIYQNAAWPSEQQHHQSVPIACRKSDASQPKCLQYPKPPDNESNINVRNFKESEYCDIGDQICVDGSIKTTLLSPDDSLSQWVEPFANKTLKEKTISTAAVVDASNTEPHLMMDAIKKEEETYKSLADILDVPKYEERPDGTYLMIKVFVSRLFKPKNVVVKILSDQLIRVTAETSTVSKSVQSMRCGSTSNVKMVKDFYLDRNIERLTLKAVCNVSGILKISARIKQNQD